MNVQRPAGSSFILPSSSLRSVEARQRSPLRRRAPNVSAAARLPILRCPINFTWSPRLSGSSSRRQTEAHRTCRFAFISNRRNFNRRNFKRRNFDRVVFATRTSSFPFANISTLPTATAAAPSLTAMANREMIWQRPCHEGG
jgi:hypothetical protein